jgi:hypothetical protein
MSLKNKYNSSKKGFINKESVLEAIVKLVVIVGITYLVNLLWNYVAPVWGLPVMGFLHFAASVTILNILLGFVASYFQPEMQIQGQNQMMSLEDFLKDLENNG